jgi:hypothetical protein
MIGMFAPFIAAEVRFFGLSDLSTARDWIFGARRERA